MLQKISLILLAAGCSERMGDRDKLLLLYNGKSILQHAVDLLSALSVMSDGICSASFDMTLGVEKIIVTTLERSKNIHIPEDVKLIFNNKPEMGQSESIKLGLKFAAGSSYMFMVADQPKLTIDDIKPLLSAVQGNTDKIIYPIVKGKPATPVIFPALFKTVLLSLTGDKGGREIRNNNPKSCIEINVENPDNFIDIDTMKEYNRFLGIRN